MERQARTCGREGRTGGGEKEIEIVTTSSLRDVRYVLYS